MNELLKHHYELLGRKVEDALNNKRFRANFVETKEEALALALSLIPEKATIGMGGSATLAEIGIKEALELRGNEVFNHQGLAPEEAKIMRLKELCADVFLSGTNAVTLSGELINVDGVGNRVAAMCFGPARVIVIVGANKIVKDEEEGRRRIKMLAAPLNVDRLQVGTPCLKTGVCMDCNSPQRICAVTTIMHTAPMRSDFHIIIVGESLGF